MNIHETGQVLAKIQAFNNRNVDEAVLRAWHEILGDYEIEDSLRAVTDHFRYSREWVMPNDITTRVDEYRRDRLNTFKSGTHLNDTDDRELLGTTEWRDATRRLTRLAAGGHITPAQYDAYQSGNLTLTNLIQEGITR